MNSNTQRHVHADIIRAWLDGKKIQIYDEDNILWCDYDPVMADGTFKFYPLDAYRIKPDTVQYRRYIYRNSSCPSQMGVGAVTRHSPHQSVNEMEKNSYFVRWIDTDWQEVEI